jgi:hypothetical protein
MISMPMCKKNMRQGSGVLAKSSLDEGGPFWEALARVDDESL